MIRTELLSFAYPDGIQALSNINLEVKKGELMALAGANGCGKTTLLKHFLGLLKPASGKIFLGDKEFSTMKQEQIFRRVGMVFQDPNDQLFATTVEQDVSFGLVNLGLPKSDVSQRTHEALEQTGIADLSERVIHNLSFGQKRRAAIAGVLAMEPEVILLDEPTSGLDPRGISAIMRLLHCLNREKNITMIMATHDIEMLPLFCDRVAVMNRGKLIKCDTPHEIFSDTSIVRESELRMPRLAHLAEILKKRNGINFKNIPLTIGQARREILDIVNSSKAQNVVNASDTEVENG